MIKFSCKKHLQEVISLSFEKMKRTQKPSPIPKIIFSSLDLEEVIPGHHDPMIISAMVVNAEVKRVLVDQGSSADIIFRDAFDKLELKTLTCKLTKKS